MPFLKHNIIFAARYLLIELLEDASPVEVWKAKDKWADGTLVILKIVASGDKLEEPIITQFRKEFSISNKLSHPHLLKVSQFDISEKENAAYLVMPFCHRGSLSEVLNEEEDGFTENQLALLMSQMGAALSALHGHDPAILHNEIRPENILVSQPGFYILTMPAFHTQGGATAHSGAQLKAAQKAYASPEFYDPNQGLGSSSDIFSLGVCLYAMCTKNLPWGGAGGESLFTVAELPRLPEHYSPELNELLQACMSNNTARRPGAEELHLRGKHFLETGKWDLSKGGGRKDNSLKRIWPFLLAAAVLGIFILSAFWEYQHNPLEIPTEKLQKMVSSDGERVQGGQEVDAMLITMLEEERNELAKRNIELEKKNKQLMYFDSVNTVTLRSLGKSVDKAYHPPVTDSPEQNALNEKGTDFTNADLLSTASSTPPKEKIKEDLVQVKIEKQLNKISDPLTSGKARTAWKEETMGQFAEGAIQIIDETQGKPKHYSASIFLNLLYNVPHRIVVKEVKTNQSKKVTELRLTMEAKN